MKVFKTAFAKSMLNKISVLKKDLLLLKEKS